MVGTRSCKSWWWENRSSKSSWGQNFWATLGTAVCPSLPCPGGATSSEGAAGICHQWVSPSYSDPSLPPFFRCLQVDAMCLVILVPAEIFVRDLNGNDLARFIKLVASVSPFSVCPSSTCKYHRPSSVVTFYFQVSTVSRGIWIQLLKEPKNWLACQNFSINVVKIFHLDTIEFLQGLIQA